MDVEMTTESAAFLLRRTEDAAPRLRAIVNFTLATIHFALRVQIVVRCRAEHGTSGLYRRGGRHKTAPTSAKQSSPAILYAGEAGLCRGAGQ